MDLQQQQQPLLSTQSARSSGAETVTSSSMLTQSLACTETIATSPLQHVLSPSTAANQVHQQPLTARDQIQQQRISTGNETSQTRYKLTQGFYNVLSSFDAKANINHTYLWKDVVRMLLFYLYMRKPCMLDPEDKNKVNCYNDPLGRLFKVSSFTKEDMKWLIRKQIISEEEDRCRHLRHQQQQQQQQQTAIAGIAPPPPSPDQSIPASRPVDTYRAADEPNRAVAVADVNGDGLVSRMATTYVINTDDEDVRHTYREQYEPISDEQSYSDEYSSSTPSVHHMPRAVIANDSLRPYADDDNNADIEESLSETEKEKDQKSKYMSAAAAAAASSSRVKQISIGTKTNHLERTTRRQLLRRKRRLKRGQLVRSGRDSRTNTFLDRLKRKIEQQNVEQNETSNRPECITCCCRPADCIMTHGRCACLVVCYRCAKIIYNRKQPCPKCNRSVHQIYECTF